jgi:hypothetical protein
MARQDEKNRSREKKLPPKSIEPQDEHWEKLKPFDDMWHDNKSRNFMVHLVHAFTPFDKGHFAWVAEEMLKPVCCICGCKLMSKNDLFKKIPEISMVSIEHLRDQVNGTLTNEKVTEDLSKITDGRVPGVVSEKSKTSFCPQCHRNFASWVEYAILRGYSHINRIIAKMRQEEKVYEKNSL